MEATAGRASRWTDAADPRRTLGREIESHAEIGSTSDRARELLASGRDGVAVVAELQVAGRGRRGRGWTSPPGRNLTVSVGTVVGLPAGDGWWLGPAAALAMRAACEPIAAVALKWPNDLVDSTGRKLGGLLVETVVEGDRLVSAVIGCGINLNWARAEMPDEIRPTATSLAELAGGEVDRVALLGRLLDALDAELAAARSGRSPLPRYRTACTTLGARVAVETADGIVEGIATEIGPRGELVVSGVRGRVALTHGEVLRVRPVEAVG